MPLLRVWQTLLVGLLGVMIAGLIKIAPAIKIDTDLADVSPINQHGIDTLEAVDALQTNIQQRIILLISSGQEENLLSADESVREALANIPNISVLPSSEDLGEQVLAGLKPYRFSLLTPKQSKELSALSADEIARAAKTNLYSMSGQQRIYSFADDPLGWHSDTLMTLLSQGINPAQQEEVLTASVSVLIEQDALNMASQQNLSKRLDQLIDDTKTAHGVTIDRSGIFFFAAHAANSSKQDITFISTGSTIGVVLLLLFVFRSLRALVLPIISIGLGVSFAFVVTHLLFGAVHILTIVFGASLIGIVIDYSLHYFYHGALQHTTDTGERHALFRALALSLTTSLIGYAALSFSGLQALQKVAMFSCCGLLMAWLSVICLGDLTAKKVISIERTLIPKLVAALYGLVNKCPKSAWLSIVALVLIGGGMIALFMQPYNDDPRVFFEPPVELLESERRVAAVANDFEPGRYIIVSGQSQSEVYQRHQVLMQEIRRAENLKQAQFTSLLSWVPSVSEQRDNYSLQAKLYNEQGAIEKLYSMLGNDQGHLSIQSQYLSAAQRHLGVDQLASLIGPGLPPLWFSQDNKVVNFVLVRKGVDVQQLSSILEGVTGVEYVNTLERTENALNEQRESATRLLLLAYALVALLMMVRFRNPRAIAMVIVPICATAMLFVVSVVCGFTLNLFHIMALFLVLGFGMDYTIFAHEMRQHSKVTLQAIFLSAITSLLSFGLLGLSAIPVVSSFGVTLLVGNLFNLLGAFVYARTQNEQMKI